MASYAEIRVHMLVAAPDMAKVRNENCSAEQKMKISSLQVATHFQSFVKVIELREAKNGNNDVTHITEHTEHQNKREKMTKNKIVLKLETRNFRF